SFHEIIKYLFKYAIVHKYFNYFIYILWRIIRKYCSCLSKNGLVEMASIQQLLNPVDTPSPPENVMKGGMHVSDEGVKDDVVTSNPETTCFVSQRDSTETSKEPETINQEQTIQIENSAKNKSKPGLSVGPPSVGNTNNRPSEIRRTSSSSLNNILNPIEESVSRVMGTCIPEFRNEET